MEIFYLCDEKFSEVFAVSLISLYEHNREDPNLNVYLIENKVTKQSKQRIQDIAAHYDRKVTLIPMPDFDKLIGIEVYVPKRLNIVDYARLFAGTILPPHIDKVLQIDCDVIIEDSLEPLWSMELGDQLASMINEGHSEGHRKVLDISENGVYYNSGIMLINLKQWRLQDIERQYVDYMKTMNGYIPVNAQGVINAVLNGRILTMPAKYNVHPLMLAFDYKDFVRLRKPTEYYSREEFEEAVKKPTIIHYMTCFYWDVRPWMVGCNHPMADKYLFYRDMTPWKKDPLWPVKKRTLRHWYCTACHVMPKWLVICLSSFLYTRLIPKQHMKKRREAAKRVTAD